ncbi:hypothetical protein PCANC_23327 [Puccinia coronata f. sp. avenae]|uniref:Uncharacterized protein n=1 Tax=Puccinia coronata f. sp. avenae TaxID=200324 RepID=A0A2N5S435_9BASI|nr:hypothetical protein PCANC_23327 [Puccinia coronata f. sp. avenae]
MTCFGSLPCNLTFAPHLQLAFLGYLDLSQPVFGLTRPQPANLWFSQDLKAANLWYSTLKVANLWYSTLKAANLWYPTLKATNLWY